MVRLLADLVLELYSSAYLTPLPGCIINVSSLMGTKGGLGATAYAASKAGVIGKKASSSSCVISVFFLFVNRNIQCFTYNPIW